MDNIVHKAATQTKRISRVRIMQIADEDRDTSYLGEYSNRADSEFSIDRAHDLDCPQQTYSDKTQIEQLERAIAYLNKEDRENGSDFSYNDDAIELLIELQDALAECTCGNESDRWNSREYRFFNTSGNYTGEPASDVIKYTIQDYERMESLNAGNWGFIGVQAEAQIEIDGISQTITSGGLWGIESDSGAEYLAGVAEEELNELRTQLHAIGFSKRAISAAFKNVEEGR